MDLTVDERPGDEATVVALAGQLDIESAPTLRAAVDGLLARSLSRIVVDLGKLSFCDSIGLSTFLVAHKHCTAAGGYLRLAAPEPFLVRVIGVIGLGGRLPVYRTVADALAGDPAGLLQS
jgi:anti-anti-sigma factor